MDIKPVGRDWLKESFDERQQKEITFAKVYDTDTYRHGTNGHNDLIIISKLATLIDMVLDRYISYSEFTKLCADRWETFKLFQNGSGNGPLLIPGVPLDDIRKEVVRAVRDTILALGYVIGDPPQMPKEMEMHQE